MVDEADARRYSSISASSLPNEPKKNVKFMQIFASSSAKGIFTDKKKVEEKHFQL